jgi:hypothetical protein
MPKIQRHSLPRPLLEHLLLRMRERKISYEEIVALGRWLDIEPEVPRGRWFKRFAGVIVCGEGEFITTFLQPNQSVTRRRNQIVHCRGFVWSGFPGIKKHDHGGVSDGRVVAGEF